MKNFFFNFILFNLFIILFCFICIIVYYHTNMYSDSNIIDNNYYFSNSNFFWPTPGYHNISSTFGKRISPTAGASSNHSGIDIVASEGTSIFSVLSGEVIFAGFYGANGHTVIIQSNEFSIQYSHISSNYIVKVR